MTAVYEIVNPSDAYTIVGDDLKALAGAVLFLGEGRYALKDTDGKIRVPFLLFDDGSGLEEWVRQWMGMSVDELLSRHSEIAECLESVVIGSFSDRKAYDAALSAIEDPAQKKVFAETWHDSKRSSMNDIGARANTIAKAMRERLVAS